jgi:Skp family chaperone for outer membrane proteins
MAHRSSTAVPIALVAAACILFPAPVKAQEKANSVLAVIDVQRVIRESLSTKSIGPQLKKIKRTYTDEVERQEKELRAADRKLAGQRAILSPDAYAEKRKEFQRKAGGAQRTLQARKRIIDQAIGKSMRKIHRAISEVTTEIAKERSIGLVLPRASVFYREKGYDITAEVLKRLNKRLPTVSVALPEKK